MSELTREQIEGWREWILRRLYPNRNDAEPRELGEQINALCNMALAWLEVQSRPNIGDRVTITCDDLAAEWRGETPEIVGITKGKNGSVTYTLKDGAGCLSDLWPESDFAITSLPEPK